jgi:arylsulfatase A-like enzyme
MHPILSILPILTLSLLTAPLSAEKPNIVLVMADDQGWGDMGYNGHPVLKTPHFDKMASEALRFDHFHAAAPVCSPTRASVMTGRHPNRMGVFKWGHALRPQEITIAEALKDAGYATGHFGKWHLGSVRKGSPVNPGACGFDEWLSAENFYDNDPILSDKGKAVPLKGESSIITADAAIEFMKKHRHGPFLAVVWFGSPHDPHRAVAEDKKHYADQPAKLQNFYGEITGMDRAFGKIRDAIAELGIRENTILWYTSDNGGLKTESSGGRAKKGSVYQGGLRVPALLEWPAAVSKPRVTKALANSSDIYPTLLEITGVKMKKQPPLDGLSLLPLIMGGDWIRPSPMGFWDAPGGGISTPSDKWMKELLDAQAKGSDPDDPGKLRLDAGKIRGGSPTDSFPGHAAWRDGDWKLHRIQKKGGAPKFELYQLADDPIEANNLAAKNPDQVAKMKPQLEKWLASVARSFNGSDYKSE